MGECVRTLRVCVRDPGALWTRRPGAAAERDPAGWRCAWQEAKAAGVRCVDCEGVRRASHRTVLGGRFSQVLDGAASTHSVRFPRTARPPLPPPAPAAVRDSQCAGPPARVALSLALVITRCRSRAPGGEWGLGGFPGARTWAAFQGPVFRRGCRAGELPVLARALRCRWHCSQEPEGLAARTGACLAARGGQGWSSAGAVLLLLLFAAAPAGLPLSGATRRASSLAPQLPARTHAPRPASPHRTPLPQPLLASDWPPTTSPILRVAAAACSNPSARSSRGGPGPPLPPPRPGSSARPLSPLRLVFVSVHQPPADGADDPKDCLRHLWRLESALSLWAGMPAVAPAGWPAPCRGGRLLLPPRPHAPPTHAPLHSDSALCSPPPSSLVGEPGDRRALARDRNGATESAQRSPKDGLVWVASVDSCSSCLCSFSSARQAEKGAGVSCRGFAILAVCLRGPALPRLSQQNCTSESVRDFSRPQPPLLPDPLPNVWSGTQRAGRGWAWDGKGLRSPPTRHSFLSRPLPSRPLCPCAPAVCDTRWAARWERSARRRGRGRFRAAPQRLE